MKKLFALLPFVLAAAVVSAQDPNPPAAGQQPKEGMKSGERMVAGEVVSTDATAKTITFKTMAPDATGDRSEKTVTMAVSESIATNLANLKSGDKVTVSFRRDEVNQKDLVTKISKGSAPKE
jgi:Cu/Ag efflux protein CusF